MRRYLETIHERSPEHKKRFALAVSGGITLIIFTIWSMTVFGPRNVPTQNVANQDKVEVTPLGSFQASVASAFESALKVIRSNAEDLEVGLETVHTYAR